MPTVVTRMVQTPFCVNNTRDPKFVSNSFGKLTSWYANRGNQNGSNSFLCKQHKGSKVRFKLVSTPDRFRAKTRCAVSLKILVWKCLLLCRSLIFFYTLHIRYPCDMFVTVTRLRRYMRCDNVYRLYLQ